MTLVSAKAISAAPASSQKPVISTFMTILLAGLLAGLGEDRKEDRSQNGDNGDDDEELDEREAAF